MWFLRRFVSPDAGALLMRHFVVETNLLNFIVAQHATSGIEPVTLRPTTLADLGDRAVIEHDINVYDVLIALGRRPAAAPAAAGLRHARRAADRRRAGPAAAGSTWTSRPHCA